VERRAGADPRRQRRRGAHDQRAAHAIALHADLLRLVDLRLRVEEGDVGGGVLLRQAGGGHRAHQRPSFCVVAGSRKSTFAAVS
jgi:hypothetical protein